LAGDEEVNVGVPTVPNPIHELNLGPEEGGIASAPLAVEEQPDRGTHLLAFPVRRAILG
jgi:hypothetical protein